MTNALNLRMVFHHSCSMFHVENAWMFLTSYNHIEWDAFVHACLFMSYNYYARNVRVQIVGPRTPY